MATLPQRSVYVQVLVIVPPHVVPFNGASVPVTLPVPSQLSVHVRLVIAGTALMHDTVIAAGAAANVGLMLSSMVMI